MVRKSSTQHNGGPRRPVPPPPGSVAPDGSTIATVYSGGGEYENVSAGSTNQALGATGAAGDFLEGLLCVVSTAATAQVQIKDGAVAAITVFPNNPGGGVGTYYVPIKAKSTNGSWKVTTAAGVDVLATGNFT